MFRNFYKIKSKKIRKRNNCSWNCYRNNKRRKMTARVNGRRNLIKKNKIALKISLLNKANRIMKIIIKIMNSLFKRIKVLFKIKIIKK